MGAQPSVTELIDNAARLDAGEFDFFFNKILTLRAQRNAPMLAKPESDLLKKINRGFPAEKWRRLTLLNEQVEEETLTAAEQTELKGLIQSYEQYTLQRLKYLGQLAMLRQVTLRSVMHELGIVAAHHG